MQVAQGQEDGFNRKCFIMIRSINSTDPTLKEKMNDAYNLECDFVEHIQDWQIAYLFFAEWHKN